MLGPKFETHNNKSSVIDYFMNTKIKFKMQ